MKNRKISAPGSLPLLPLHTLGWKGFQDLCGTILREVLGQTYQIWPPGNDGGRDGAFHGHWTPTPNSSLAGAFVVQCKHTSEHASSLKSSDLSEEFNKARELASKGLADSYILMTNHRITGDEESKISLNLKNSGVKNLVVFGLEWISAQAYENQRLRMLVPRIYGLGDLSQIIDERGYAQAHALLSSLKYELTPFVPTGAFRKSQKALSEHNLVFLLGEPASGKSTIAAILCLNAIDQWESIPIKITTASQFEDHWNPNDPNQLFWVDDVFGATQYDRNLASSWNHLLPKLRTAISLGTRIVFTSRDYIFKQSQFDLKHSILSIIDPAKITIHIEELTQQEKEEITYNHIKLERRSGYFEGAGKRQRLDAGYRRVIRSPPHGGGSWNAGSRLWSRAPGSSA